VLDIVAREIVRFICPQTDVIDQALLAVRGIIYGQLFSWPDGSERKEVVVLIATNVRCLGAIQIPSDEKGQSYQKTANY
jgi:hypothetical protein